MKVAIVSGGSGGIGWGCVKKYLDFGYRVISLDLVPVSFTPGLHQYRCDMRDTDAIAKTIQDIAKEYKRIDVLVCNAGVHPPATRITEAKVSDFNELVAINLTSAYTMCIHAFPALMKTRGSIIFVSSMVALHGQEDAAAYCATKAGQLGLMKALAVEGAPYGIRVNAVCPSNVLTPAMQKWLQSHSDPQKKEDEMAAVQKLGRMASADEIASCICFLTSGAASFVTGIVFCADGGSSLGYPIAKL